MRLGLNRGYGFLTTCLVFKTGAVRGVNLSLISAVSETGPVCRRVIVVIVPNAAPFGEAFLYISQLFQLSRPQFEAPTGLIDTGFQFGGVVFCERFIFPVTMAPEYPEHSIGFGMMFACQPGYN